MFDAASGDRTPEVRRDVLLRLAVVFENDFGDLDRTEKVLVQVLSENERDTTALESLDRIYVAQAMHENLALVLRQRIALAERSEDLVELQLRLGRVLADSLDDVEGAIGCYLAVLEQESRSLEALEALERLYFRSERWVELYGVYEKLVDVAKSDEDIADCYARMAKLAADALDQREKAVELWGKVLDLRGDDGVALGGLADLHEAAGEWKELTEVLEKLVVATPDPEHRVPIYKRLGRIWGENLGRERNALESWQKVLEIDPRDVDALRAIVENYRSAGAWEELSEALRRLIQVAQLGESGVSQTELQDLYSQLGELEGETLMRTQEAIEAWREVLEIDPHDFRALAALEKLFMQEARWEDAVDILERRVAALANPAEQVDVLMQAAALWADRIGDGGAAAQVYERVLQIDASNQAASQELEQLYRQRKSWVKLIDLLLARTEFVTDATTRIGLLVQVAETYEQQLNDLESAFVTLQAAFREDYSNDHVAKELERLATSTKRWNELISEYTQLVQGITDPKQAADLWVKIARWYDSALGHIEYAITSAQQALQIDAGHVGALTALADFYRKQKRWGDLVGVLAMHADLEQEAPKKVDLLLSLADAYETQIGDAAQATYAYQRALDTDEHCLDAINALERLYRRTQAWDRLVDVLAKKALVVEDQDLAVRLRLQVGELWEDRLGDNARAVDAYKEVLSVDPQNLAALKALDTLYQKTGNMEAYLENLEHQLEVSSPEGDRIEIYQRMASVWEERFSKTDRAAEVLEKVLLIDGANQKALRDLERHLQPGQEVGGAGRDLPQAHRGRGRSERAHRAADARPARYWSRSCEISTARSTRTTRRSSSTDQRRGSERRRPAVRGDRAVGAGGRRHAPVGRHRRRSQAEGRPQLPPRQDPRRAAAVARGRRGVPGRIAGAGPDARAVDAVVARPLQAAGRLAEDRAADGAGGGQHRQPAREDPPAVTRPARSTRRSWATRRWRRSFGRA